MTMPIGGMDYGPMPGVTGDVAESQMVGRSGMNAEMSMMVDLWKLPAPRLDAVVLSMMIPHHQGAIDMANLVPARASHQQLRDLATSIIQSQLAEIHQMNNWLATWFNL
jgi:uncharacterized protein (DUF305 family)